MKNRTKNNMKYQFNRETRKIICERDGRCIFCSRGYHMENRDAMLYGIADIMHYRNKSAGGLGIPENGALGCRYHHNLLDNGSKGLREEMLGIFRDHLQQKYPGWDERKLVYNKWDFLTSGQ